MQKVQSIRLKGIILLFTFSISLIVNGQGHVIFEQLSIKDGLSNGTVNAIFRDSRGYMWFCTEDGLNRYDGYNFKVFRSERSDKLTEQNIQFIDIVEDSFHRIWIGTSEGLFLFDQDNDRIVRFLKFSGIDLTNLAVRANINSLYTDTFHFLWVGTYNGIYRININTPDVKTIKKEDITFFINNPNDPLSLSDNNVTSICEDKQNLIWISTFSDQLDCYDSKNNKFIHHKIGVTDLKIRNSSFKKLKIDRNDNIWIGIRDFGIIYWDRKEDKFIQYKSLLKEKKEIDIRFVRTVMIDKLDRLWIGTDGNGIVVYDIKKDEIDHYRKGKDDQSNLSSNAIYSIYEDSTDIIWVGTYITGLNKLVSSKLNFGVNYSLPNSETGLSHNIVTGFCEDKKNQIWISTDGGGINLYDRKTNLFKHFKHDPKNPESLSIDATVTIFCDRDNNLWVGTYNGGLNRFDQKTQKFYHYWNNPDDTTSLSSNHPWGFVQDKLNNLWIATVSEGLNLLKPSTSSFTRYSTANLTMSDSNHLICKAITQMFIDKDNQLWIATEYGLDLVNLNMVNFSLPKPILKFKHFLHSENENSISNDRVRCINQDNFGNLWIGTNGSGLDKLELKTFTFTNYSVKDGLPHNIIDGILFDRDNNLWISTNNGLSNFNISTGKFINYNTSDGLQSSVFSKTACLKTHDGMFLFGGINGFNAFYPEKISLKNSRLTAVITDFKLFNQSVGIGEKINTRVILPKPIAETDEINLNYKENNISFEFSAMDYSNPEKNYFSYKLDGFDDKWQITGAEMRIAKYTNLSPGQYTFKVKASTNNEIWSESSTSVKVIVRPPWWKTWWFKISAVILAIALWIVGFAVRVYSLEKQKTILKTRIDEKTKLLKIANKQLSESNLMKDKFLTIIAHDLINPFNTILGFTDLLLTNYSNWDDQSRIETIKTINESSNNLYNLLGNLLQWSRSERGLLDYSPEKIDLNNCISKITTLLSVSALSKNINIELKTSDECCQVKSDTQLLNAILRNLISNSIKFTPLGGHITIQTECRAKNILVSVIDNGIGISKEKLENLFRIDVQHSTLGTNSEKGTGLGLFLVKEFVTKQQGTLTIKSEPGKGSTFSFTVPLWVEKLKR